MVTSRSMARKAMGATAIVALLGGCGDAGGALGDRPTVSGRIQDWTLGAATLNLSLIDSSQTPISAPVDPAGHFSVTLPGAAAVAGSLAAPDFTGGNPSCAGSVTVSPATVLAAQADFEVSKTVQSGGDTVMTLGELTLGATAPDTNLGESGEYTLSILYAYFSEDASASGMLTCGPQITTVNFDVSKGWNTLRVVSLDGLRDVSSGPPPSAAEWTASLGKIGCASDDDCDLEPCDLSAGMCSACVVSGDSAEDSIDCCNPTAAGTGTVVCH